MKTNRFGRSTVLTTNQLDLLINELPPGVHTVLASVCRRTGCRISEARQLEWKNLKTIEKGEEPSPGSYVFVGRFGDKPITRQAHGKVLKTTIERLGLKGVSSHSYRRSALSSASSKGLPLKAIQTLSGHKSLAVLSRYLEVSELERQNVAQAFA